VATSNQQTDKSATTEVGRPWWFLAGEEKENMGNDQTVMDSRKGIHDDVDKIEMNLGVKAEFTGDVQGSRKSSPNHRWKFAGTQAVDEKLQREVEEATSGGSR
jgi:hypothetical protein